MKTRLSGQRGRRGHNGIILVVVLIMLVVISLLAATTMRNALSSEGISGNVRLNQLATQAAEAALRYCEDSVAQMVHHTTGIVSLPTIHDLTAPPKWSVTATWDVSPSVVFVLPLNTVNDGAAAVYLRPPECLVERLAPAGTAEYSTTFVITARGFGPDVPAAPNGARPEGNEVFLQSTIEM